MYSPLLNACNYLKAEIEVVLDRIFQKLPHSLHGMFADYLYRRAYP